MLKRKKTIAEVLRELSGEPLKKRKHWNSLQIMVPGFIGVILLGTLILMLPICNADGQWLNFTDALFTACTCVCVTGLVTVVPAVQFTILGKLVLLFLIQIGGWGVIVCALWLLVLLKRKISLNSRVIIHDYFNMDTMSGMVRMLIFVVKGSLLVEALGALCYAFCFVPEYGPLKGIWYSVFHAVSAFCNAGVDLLGSSSLMQYVRNPWMNLVTIALIVTGGLGFMVWKDLGRFGKNVLCRRIGWRKAVRATALHTKIVVVMTVLLITGGTLFFFAAEQGNPETLGTLSTGAKWMAALFQSVTTRTAGFCTISQAGLREASKFVACMMMFIGGSPASTAGGMKTVTIAVIFLTCWSILKGHSDTECFKRKVAAATVRMAIAVFAMGMVMVLAGTTLLSLLEPQIPLIDVLYEVISAVATVGLTADVTPELSTVGKYVIIFLMYVGRIGPVTLPMLMAAKLGRKNDKRTLPEEHIVVG